MENQILNTIHIYWQEDDPGYAFQHKLQRIINKYLHQAHPEKTDPDIKKLTLQVVDQSGNFVGGSIILVHQDWIEIRLIALADKMRGLGLGRRMLSMIEEKAWALDCDCIRAETCEVNVGFYQKCGYKMGGKLEDYPPGLNYFWLHKDLEA